MSTYCLNTGNLALTKFVGFSFRKVLRVGGVYYGVGPEGVCAIDSAFDGDASIVAVVTLAATDYDISMKKRVMDTKMSTEGFATCSVQLDDSYEASIGEVTSDSTAFKYGKGSVGRYIRTTVYSESPEFTLWNLCTRFTPVRSRGGPTYD